RLDANGKPFVLLDSPYNEIHTLRLDPKGVIYAAALSGPGGVTPPSAPQGNCDTPPPVTAALSLSPELTPLPTARAHARGRPPTARFCGPRQGAPGAARTRAMRATRKRSRRGEPFAGRRCRRRPHASRCRRDRETRARRMSRGAIGPPRMPRRQEARSP